jgi:hypothetical protein
VLTCDGGEVAAVGFDNLPLVAGEPGSGRFDMPFTLPREAIGKGYIEQLIPERSSATAARGPRRAARSSPAR